MAPRTRPRIVLGIVLFVCVLVLGVLARTHLVTQADLHADIDISHLRSGGLTPLEKGLSAAAGVKVGAIALVVVAAILVILRRRWDALRAVGVAGAAWVTALIVKKAINEPRPPSSVWLVRPDHSGSFPSGTTTTSVVLFLLVLLLAWRSGSLRRLVMVAGTLFALAVGFSRLYLGDHYPLDVLGAYLTVTATTIFTLGVLDTMWARQLAARWLRAPEAALTAPAPYGSHSRYSRRGGYSGRHGTAELFEEPDGPQGQAGTWQPDAATQAWTGRDAAGPRPQDPAQPSWGPDAATQAWGPQGTAGPPPQDPAARGWPQQPAGDRPYRGDRPMYRSAPPGRPAPGNPPPGDRPLPRDGGEPWPPADWRHDRPERGDR
jgi:membrane-associated phospholipid phosphatase